MCFKLLIATDGLKLFTVTAKVVLGQLGSKCGSQQKADVVKTDYSDSLLMITKMITGLIQG